MARNARVAPELLERATLSLAHRGPDDSGHTVVRVTSPEPVEVGLGSRRLAILDLSQLGHQPMQDRDTGNWIAFNGEIYNFREVRQKLERLGLRFRSDSDTEVVLRGYGAWQEGVLRELRGMFAFIVWDAQRRCLFAARDPLGVKPLYYASCEPYFLLASETKTLLNTGLFRQRIDRSALRSYLLFGSACDPASLIEGVQALPAGHYLVAQGGSVRQVKYWDLKPEASRQVSEAEKPQRLDEMQDCLDEAVRMQMVSDVPVGVFLSGGIDSSSLAGILSRNKIQISTFSIVFRESDFSEAEFSRKIAAKFRTDHHEILVSQQDALEAIPAALEAMDQPSIDGLNTYLVSRHTRAAGIKVALSGLGSDEMFAGYSTFRDVPRMERILEKWAVVPGFMRFPTAELYRRMTSANDQNNKLADLIANDGALVHPYFLARMLFTPAQCGDLLGTNSSSTDHASTWRQDVVDSARTLDPINRVSYLEARCYMQNTLLRDADVMSMAHGLEVRVPFIDHHLAEKLIALPGQWKMDPTTPKPLLVDALRGTLPDEIVHRQKRGFTLPFEHWLRDELKMEAEKTLGRIKDGPLGSILRESAVQEIWNDFLAGRTSWSRPWSLFVLQQWCERRSLEV